jgi:hypothetical protein
MNKKQFERAIREYWKVRTAQAERQQETGNVDAGLRGAVTGGAQMDAIALLLEEVFLEAGFPPESVSRASRLELPGYFRAEKKWDLVVVHDGQLAAAIELKSQVGPSFGKNFNNRNEEAIGSATDIWTAYREGRFGETRPWLGYLFLLEEHPKSTCPVGVKEPFFPAEDIFRGASYKKRYELLCRRLVLERLYDATCFVTSTANPKSPIHEPADDLSVENFIRQIRGRAAQLIEVDR